MSKCTHPLWTSNKHVKGNRSYGASNYQKQQRQICAGGMRGHYVEQLLWRNLKRGPQKTHLRNNIYLVIISIVWGHLRTVKTKIPHPRQFCAHIDPKLASRNKVTGQLYPTVTKRWKWWDSCDAVMHWYTDDDVDIIIICRSNKIWPNLIVQMIRSFGMGDSI